jgi:hypothetical protein
MTSAIGARRRKCLTRLSPNHSLRRLPSQRGLGMGTRVRFDRRASCLRDWLPAKSMYARDLFLDTALNPSETDRIGA